MPISAGLAPAARLLAGSLGPGIRTLAKNVANGAAFETGRKLVDAAFGFWLEYSDNNPYDTPYKPGICQIPYSVVVTYRILTPGGSSQDGVFTAEAVVWGPIGTASVQKTLLPGPPAQNIFRIFLTHYGATNQAPTGPQKTQIAGPGSAPSLAQISVLNVESSPFPPGASGECPILPPAPPYRPEDFTTDIDITYPGPSGTPITIPFTAVVGLFYVKADLSLNMPVTFNIKPTLNANLTANFKVQGTLNLDTGDFEVDWITGDEPNTPPPALPPASRPPLAPIGNPAPPKPPSIPDETPDPEDEVPGAELVGVIVTSTFNSAKGTVSLIGQTDNPDIYVPTIGYVSFAVRTGDGSVGWTNDIPIKNLRAYIPVPFNSKAVSVKGTPKPEFTWALTPVYSKVLQLA